MKALKYLFYLFLGIVITYVFVHFLVWQLPGSIADVLSDSESNLEDLKQISAHYTKQTSYGQSLRGFLLLDWGKSELYQEESYTVIREHLLPTLKLTLLSLFFTFVFSFLYFVPEKKTAQRFSNLFLALPGIALFPLLVLVMCLFSSFCPAGSAQQGKALLIAAVAQAFLAAPRFYRELQWEIEELRRQRFVLVLRAKGISRAAIWGKHIFRNVLPPFVSLTLLTFLGFISGAVLVESLFDLPGLGLLLLEAIKSRDLNLIFPLVMFLSVLHLFSLRSSSLLRRINID